MLWRTVLIMATCTMMFGRIDVHDARNTIERCAPITVLCNEKESKPKNMTK